jgi:hypothetical protein
MNESITLELLEEILLRESAVIDPDDVEPLMEVIRHEAQQEADTNN